MASTGQEMNSTACLKAPSELRRPTRHYSGKSTAAQKQSRCGYAGTRAQHPYTFDLPEWNFEDYSHRRAFFKLRTGRVGRRRPPSRAQSANQFVRSKAAASAIAAAAMLSGYRPRPVRGPAGPRRAPVPPRDRVPRGRTLCLRDPADHQPLTHRRTQVTWHSPSPR